jgi:FkbM family methyltransferase
MNLINETLVKYENGVIDKPSFIKAMYEEHHAALFGYSTYLQKTNIASIEITDDAVVMTSRDKGVKMICPPGDHRVAPIEALNFLDYETIDSAMIMKLVSPNDCVVDIGANMGWYSINIAKTYPSCKVHAFEPIPKTYGYLEKNIKLNQLGNIFPHHFGLSSERKDLTFYFYPEGSGNASSANLSERKDAELVTCHVEKLDDFVITNKLHVDFIKCDVEGTELFAFQGAVETLKRDKPIVFTEMLRKWAKKFDYHPNEIIKLFTSLGYHCFYAEGNTLKKLDEMTDETVETNFFFLHAEKHLHQIHTLTD